MSDPDTDKLFSIMFSYYGASWVRVNGFIGEEIYLDWVDIIKQLTEEEYIGKVQIMESRYKREMDKKGYSHPPTLEYFMNIKI